jgi:hyperosmotically inducible periplasmic protein
LNSTVAGLMLITLAGCGKPADAPAMPSSSTATGVPPSPSGTPSAGTTVGTAIDDTVVTTKVKTALMDDASMKSLAVSVETIKGDVRLSGFVDNQAQIEQALKVARGVEGVKSVKNELAVKK